MYSTLNLFIKQYGLRNLAFLGFVFSLMFPMLITTLMLLVYSLMFVIEYKKINKLRFSLKAFVFCAIPGLIVLLGFLFFESKSYNLKELEKNIVFFLLPTLCYFDIRTLKKIIPQIIVSLFLGIVSVEMWSLGVLILKNELDILYNYIALNFNNDYLSDYVDIHHSYFSLLLSISLIGVFTYYKEIKVNKIVLNVLIFISLFYNFLLFARTTLMVFVVISAIFLLIKKRKATLIFLTVFFCLFIYVLNKDSYTINRLTFDSGSEDITKRMELNRVSLAIFKQAPWFGVGPGRVRYERLKQYQEIDYVSAYKYIYNSHNQYLNYLSVNGVFGLLAFLFMFFYINYVCLKRKQWFLLSIFLLFFSSCITESYLVRNKGIFIYCFLLVLFLLYNFDLFQTNEKDNKSLIN